MASYAVSIYQTLTFVINVEAGDESSAREKAIEAWGRDKTIEADFADCDYGECVVELRTT